MINEFQKWPSDKKKFDREFLRLYGNKCSKCNGTGEIRDCILYDDWEFHKCPFCNGIGYIEKPRKNHEQ